MSWPKKAVALVADLLGWFWLGTLPGWYKPGWYRKKRAGDVVNLLTPTRTIPAVRTGAGTVVFSRRSVVPVSPAAPTAEMVVAAPTDKLGPRQRNVSEAVSENTDEHMLPVDLDVAEEARVTGRVSVDALDSPTALMRVLESETLVENPCVACGKESTSALLDRCEEHDKQVLYHATTVPMVHPVAWITGQTTDEFEILLERELARATGLT